MGTLCDRTSGVDAITRLLISLLLCHLICLDDSIPQFKYEDLPAIRVDEKEHWGISEDNRGLASRIPTLEEVCGDGYIRM